MALTHRTATDSWTRLANTTPYTAGDTISDHGTTPTKVLTFSAMSKGDSRGGKITGGLLISDNANVTNAAFDLYLFDTTVAVAGFKDNLTCAVTDAEFKTAIGLVSFAAAGTLTVITGSVSTSESTFSYSLPAGSKDIYGVLIARGAYTPASGEVLTIRLHAELD